MELTQIMGDALDKIAKHKLTFAKNCLPAIAALVFIGGGLSFAGYLDDVFLGNFTISVFFVFLFAIIALLCMFAKSAVHIHRTFVLGETATIKELFTLKSRDLRFIGYFIILQIIVIILSIILLLILGTVLANIISSIWLMGILTFATTLLIMAVWSRLAIVLPATALDLKMSIGEAWEVSKGYSLKLFFGVGLLPTITSVLMDLLPGDGSLFSFILVCVIWPLVVIFEIGVLSLMFKHISQDYQQEFEH